LLPFLKDSVTQSVEQVRLLFSPHVRFILTFLVHMSASSMGNTPLHTCSIWTCIFHYKERKVSSFFATWFIICLANWMKKWKLFEFTLSVFACVIWKIFFYLVPTYLTAYLYHDWKSFDDCRQLLMKRRIINLKEILITFEKSYVFNHYFTIGLTFYDWIHKSGKFSAPLNGFSKSDLLMFPTITNVYLFLFALESITELLIREYFLPLL